MSRSPLKAMKAVKRYCEKKKTCKGCPLHSLDEYGRPTCINLPENWNIKKAGDSDA